MAYLLTLQHEGARTDINSLFKLGLGSVNIYNLVLFLHPTSVRTVPLIRREIRAEISRATGLFFFFFFLFHTPLVPSGPCGLSTYSSLRPRDCTIAVLLGDGKTPVGKNHQGLRLLVPLTAACVEPLPAFALSILFI